MGHLLILVIISPLHEPVTWYGINYGGTQGTQWDSKTKESRAGLLRVPKPVPGPPSVRTIEKASGRQAGPVDTG